LESQSTVTLPRWFREIYAIGSLSHTDHQETPILEAKYARAALP
jgi:hypothetical protein